MAEQIRRALAAGSTGGFGLSTDDCRKTHDELVAKGVEFVQPPSDRPYGVEAVMRDNSGNWLVLVEHRAFTGEDFAHGRGPSTAAGRPTRRPAPVWGSREPSVRRATPSRYAATAPATLSPQ